MSRYSALRFRIAVAAALLGCIATPAVLHACDIVFRGRIGSGNTVTRSFYVGGSDRYVIVKGDESTDLDCWIYNSENELADSDTGSSDYCVLATPGVGTHRLVIRNLGRIPNDYVVTKE